MSRRRASLVAVVSVLASAAMALPVRAASSADVPLTNDDGGRGYVSAYTLATGRSYSDAILDECSRSRGRQNEPAVAVDPRDTDVLIGSSNDYCGTYAGSGPANNFGQPGPIWLGYYRSEDAGASFTSSLVPGYPGDRSPYAALTDGLRTAGAGDPVIAWDAHGRAFLGAEASEDPAGSLKTFGDSWVARYVNPQGPNGPTSLDGLQYAGTERVAKGSSAPFLLGVFNDKTAIEADRTDSRCEGNVYFAWSRFSGGAGNVSIYFSRSTDHGVSWSKPKNLTPGAHDVQNPDIAITSNGDVYVAYRQFPTGGNRPDAVSYVRSTNCGATFGRQTVVERVVDWEQQDIFAPVPVPGEGAVEGRASAGEEGEEEGAQAPGSLAVDCGDFFSACLGPYTFFRNGTQVRATADQYDERHPYVYFVYDASKPGTRTRTGSTYGTIRPGVGSQSGVYFVRLNGRTGSTTPPRLLDPQSVGHQIFPDVSADAGVLHAVWYDSRRDPTYSPARPIGNDASGRTHPAIDVFATASNDRGDSWSRPTRLTDVSSNPNYEQYSDRTSPFYGDYIWVTSFGRFAFAAWTDARDVVPGGDPRESGDEDHDRADVVQCREFLAADGVWTGDMCPHRGGLDSDILGSRAP